MSFADERLDSQTRLADVAFVLPPAVPNDCKVRRSKSSENKTTVVVAHVNLMCSRMISYKRVISEFSTAQNFVTLATSRW